MNITLILFKQIVIMFILIAIGYYLYKKKFVTLTGSNEIGKILLNLVIPIVIINSFWTERTIDKTNSLIHTAIVSIIVMGIAVLVSTIIFGKKNGVACFSSAFSNAGFIGIPLVQAVVGADAVFYISIMIVLINFLQWTYGIYVMTSDPSVMKPSVVMKNPIVISVLIGIVIYFLNIPRVDMVNTVISNITCINTPLAMFVSGIYLAQSQLLEMIKRKETWYVCLIRLILIPCISAVILKLIPFGANELKIAILLAAACPVGSNVAIFAQQYDKDYTTAVEQVCLSTILCLFTIPLVVTITTALL